MTEDELWRAAYYIAFVGASNPKGVSRTLEAARASSFEVELHPAARAIRDHLDYLERHGTGPSFGDLDLVISNARRLGLIKEAC